MVHGFDETYGDEMDVVIKNWQTSESLRELARYELGDHGMVILDGEGEPLWKEQGHQQKKEIVESEIKKALGL